MTMETQLVQSFTIERSEPELLAPAKPTPYEFKLLSALDDQKGFRKQNRSIQFYRNSNMEMHGRDPVKVIREAISQTLVHYYPFAGRLREGPNDTLLVECTGEGVIFIEANAGVRLEQFGNIPQPPFPGAKDLLFDVPGSGSILNSPLLLIQVTRLTCGGFIVAIRRNHVLCDATGFVQFLMAVGEIANGANVPSVKPVWKRELLIARDPPQVSCLHPVYHELPESRSITPLNDTVKVAQRSFFFGPREIAGLRRHVPTHLNMCSKFDLLTASIWRCRTIALTYDCEDEVRVAFPVEIRAKLNPSLPKGYYGNAFGLSAAQTTAGKLCQNPLGYALELVRSAKTEVTDEFMRSLVDFLDRNGRPCFKIVRTFYVSDSTRLKYKDVDYGWGKALYGGPLWGGQPASFFISSKNNNGEDGTVVTMDLPEPVMERFAEEIQKMSMVPI